LAKACAWPTAIIGKEISMSTVQKKDHVTGWTAVGLFATVILARALTAFVMSIPITWLARHIFAHATLALAFGSDGLTYWRCVGLFAVWFAATMKIRFSGQVDADR
jgi:hypothetical protein